jgi:hypothetical protein
VSLRVQAKLEAEQAAMEQELASTGGGNGDGPSGGSGSGGGDTAVRSVQGRDGRPVFPNNFDDMSPLLRSRSPKW